MKKTLGFIVVTSLLVIFATACAPNQTTAPQLAPQTALPSQPTDTTNQLFVSYLSTGQDLISNQTLQTCLSAYPNLGIASLSLNQQPSYVVDQNPTTVTYDPTIEIVIDNEYKATVKTGEFILKKNDVVVTDTNIINLVTSQLLAFKNVKATVELQAIDNNVLIKNITCTIN